MGNLLTGIAKWTYVWVPALATFVGLFFTFRHYCPKPTIQAPPPGIETRRDSDGPFLQVKLWLGNPGVSTIYCESVILKPQGFKKLTAGPDGHKNVSPEQSSPRRLPFLQFKAKGRLCRKGRRALPEQIRVKILYRYRSGPWPRTRTLRLSATIRKSDLIQGGLLKA
jgi:hypothetical protein